MKKIGVIFVLVLISISPFFRGLFFDLEMNIFLSLISICTMLFFLVKLKKGKSLQPNRLIYIPMLLLIFSHAMSLSHVIDIREQITSTLHYVEFFVIVAILIDFFKDEQESYAKLLMPLYVFIGFVCAIFGLVPYFHEINLFGEVLVGEVGGDKLVSTFQYPNTASIYFVICFLFAMTLMNMTISIFLRAMLAAAANTLFFSFLQTSSRGGFIIGSLCVLIFLVFQKKANRFRNVIQFMLAILPVFVVVGKYNVAVTNRSSISSLKWIIVPFVMAFVISLMVSFILWIPIQPIAKKWIKRFSVVVFSVFLLSIVGAIFLYWDKFMNLVPLQLFERLMNTDFIDGNWSNRLIYYEDALKLIHRNWIFGVGNGGWTSQYQSVQETFYTARDTHNHYLETFIELGIVGFLAFIGVVVASVINYIKALNARKREKIYLPILGMFCAFLALALHSAIDFDFSYISLFLLFWVMAAGSAIYASDLKTGDKRNHNTIESVVMEKTVLKTEITGRTANLIMAAICAILISVNGLFLLASYNAHLGNLGLKNLNYTASMLYYEEANRLDSLNTTYTFELSKLYAFFAKNSSDRIHASQWNEKARSMAETSVRLNGFFPAYRETLANAYTQIGMPLKALEELKKLVVFQRCNQANYELLYEGYLKAAAYYIAENDTESAKSSLTQCLAIEKGEFVVMTPAMEASKEKALVLLQEMKVTVK